MDFLQKRSSMGLSGHQSFCWGEALDECTVHPAEVVQQSICHNVVSLTVVGIEGSYMLRCQQQPPLASG